MKRALHCVKSFMYCKAGAKCSQKNIRTDANESEKFFLTITFESVMEIDTINQLIDLSAHPKNIIDFCSL